MWYAFHGLRPPSCHFPHLAIHEHAYFPVILSYALGFGAVTACVTHVGLFYGKDVLRQFQRSLNEEPDIHARLMSRYREVPYFWYGGIFLASFVMAIVAIKVYHTELPVWLVRFGPSGENGWGFGSNRNRNPKSEACPALCLLLTCFWFCSVAPFFVLSLIPRFRSRYDTNILMSIRDA